MKSKLLFILLLTTLPAATYAQKAFEMAHYNGTIQGKTVRFNLANGYIGASQISFNAQAGRQPLIYQPESGVADEPFLLKCTDGKHADYFTLDKPQEVYEKLPPYISGKYYNGKQVTAFKFYRSK